MYQNFFQFTRSVFSAAPDSALLYSTALIERTLQSLEQTLIQGEGIGLLTAPAGVGKTLICKAIRDRLASHSTLCTGSDGIFTDSDNHLEKAAPSEGPFPVLLLQSQFPTRSSLLQTILFELNRPYARMSEQELRLELISYGRNLAQKHHGIAIIVDEAHLLGEHILEELRGLTNYMFCADPIFRVVLSGQLALEETLTSRSLEAVNQRLSCHVTLETLTRQESIEYIETRIQGSGAICSDVFTPEALDLIVRASDGLPRCLNQLCDHTCLLASLSGTKPAGESHVREALDDLVKLPLHWNIPQARLDPVSELNGSSDSCENCGDCENNCNEANAESVIEIVSEEDHVIETSPVQVTQNTEEASDLSESATVFEIGGPASSEIETPSLSSESNTCEETATDFDQVEDGFDKVAFEQGLEEEPVVAEQLGQLEVGAAPDIIDEIEAEDCEPPVEISSSIETVSAPEESVEQSVEEELQKAESAIEEIIESELTETVIETVSVTPAQRQDLAESLLSGIAVPDHAESCMEEPCDQQPKEEAVQDRYAALDARRLGQLSEVASIEPCSNQDSPADLTQNGVEHGIEQSVLELTAELSVAIGEAGDDIVPNPQDIIITASESFPEEEEAEYDIVEPEDC